MRAGLREPACTTGQVVHRADAARVRGGVVVTSRRAIRDEKCRAPRGVRGRNPSGARGL
jgi:hypothetical protein